MSHPSLYRTVFRGLLVICLCALFEGYAGGQTATYHLHKDTSSTTGLNQLKTAGPDASTLALNSANLRNLATGEHIIKAFDTQSGVPNASGVIPAASTVTFTLWMKKSANVGTMFPRAKLRLNSASGTSLCTSTGSSALTTTLTKYTLTCATAGSISMAASDRFYLWVGVNLTAGSSSTFQGTLNVEGTLNGNYNSKFVTPLPVSSPSISGLSVSAGPVGTSVTVNGSNFGASQGSSSLTFNGVASTPGSWSATSIVAPVPAAATTGPIVVTVGGTASNGVSFTVTPKINSLSPTVGSVGTAVTISGSTFGATQGSNTVKFNGTSAVPTNWSATSITVQVPPGSTSGAVVVTVGGSQSNGSAFTVASSITNLTPASGAIGDSITVSGTNFGATQGASTITFNGTNATPSNWTNSSIVVPVPSGATSGPVVVTIGGVSSAGVNFTILPKITGISPGSGTAGQQVVISGASFGATQASSTVTFNGTAASPASWSAGSISVPVPAGATTGPVVVTVAGAASNGVVFNVTGTLSGKVTVTGGTTPISGAAVKALQDGAVVTQTTTNSAGDYSLPALAVGTYSLEVSASGYGTKLRNLIAVSATPVVVDISLVAIVSGPVSYIYDPLGRLISTVGPTETIGYSYDPVGNLLSISRASSSVVSVINFTPLSGTTGTVVTINGTGFSSTAVENTVQFNGSPATITSATNTKITTVVPSGATTGPISVTSPAGSATSSLPFTVGEGAAPNITSFTPNIGMLGDTVTISGSNFAPIAADNKVKFNSIQTQITSATESSIVTVVSTTVSGKISLTTPYGTTVAPGDFFVPPPPYTAAHVEFAGRISLGQTMTLSINTANKIAMVLFDGLAGQRISIDVGPSPISQGFVHIYRPDGSKLVESLVLVPWANRKFIEPLSLPVTGPYTIVFGGAGTATGSTPIAVYAVPPDVTGSLPIGGPSQAVTNLVPGQNASLTFTGTQGQQVSLRTNGSNIIGSASIKNPDGSVLGLSAFHPPGLGPEAFIDKRTLPATGTYTVYVDPNVHATGTTNVQLYDAADSVSPITPGGGPMVVSITNPGQNAIRTFNGTSGQRIALSVSSSGIGYDVYIKRPDGSVLAQMNVGSGWNGWFFDTMTLTTSGAYTILVDLFGASTGNITLNLFDVPPDVTGSVTLNGPAQPVNTVPGQNASLTFAGTQGQQVSLRTSGSNMMGLISIKNPDGSVLGSGGFLPPNLGPEAFIDKRTLLTTGTYTVFVDPSAQSTGTTNVQLFDVSDSVTPITPGSGPLTVSITNPGQNAVLTFNGTSGQRIALSLSSSGIAYDVYIKRPDGSVMAQMFINSGWTGGFFDALTLNVSGTHTILVDPTGMFTGNVTLNLLDVPADLTGSLTLGAPAVPVAISAVGQNANFTFEGIAGQQVTVRVTGSSYGCVLVSLLNPSGATLAAAGPCTNSFNLATWTLPVTGTYTVKVDPSGQSTGALNLSITNP